MSSISEVVFRSFKMSCRSVSIYLTFHNNDDSDEGFFIETNKNNKLMAFRVNYEKLLEKYKTICTKIEELKNIELNALPVYMMIDI